MPSLNKMMKAAVNENRNLIVPWYLCAAYAYYELDQPFLTDGGFDWMAKKGLAEWDVIEHSHKRMITTDDLRAGTLLRRDWPSIVKGSTKSLILQHRELNRKRV